MTGPHRAGTAPGRRRTACPSRRAPACSTQELPARGTHPSPRDGPAVVNTRVFLSAGWCAHCSGTQYSCSTTAGGVCQHTASVLSFVRTLQKNTVSTQLLEGEDVTSGPPQQAEQILYSQPRPRITSVAVLSVSDKCLGYVYTMCILPAHQRCDYSPCHFIIVDLKCRGVFEKYKLSLSFCALALWKVLTILCTRDF